MLSPSATHRPCGCCGVRSSACFLLASMATPVSRMSDGSDSGRAGPDSKGLRLEAKSGRRKISAKSERGRSSAGRGPGTSVAPAPGGALLATADGSPGSSPMTHQLTTPSAATTAQRVTRTTLCIRDEPLVIPTLSAAGLRRYRGALRAVAVRLAPDWRRPAATRPQPRRTNTAALSRSSSRAFGVYRYLRSHLRLHPRDSIERAPEREACGRC